MRLARASQLILASELISPFTLRLEALILTKCLTQYILSPGPEYHHWVMSKYLHCGITLFRKGGYKELAKNKLENLKLETS